ncbi:MAG: EAL domain-containing protein [Longimicrobiales bacterium]|nr:EAL domain-containing protein [Longimicrobiales bacterium]
MNGPLYRTLVVEDDPSTLLFLQEVLRSRGHNVEACAEAETAWELAQREHFSLAILDMWLPGMDGAALCRKLRKLPRADEMVVMFITGADRLEDLGSALDAGADDYLVKPVNSPNLPVRLALAERRVHFLLDRKRTEAGLLRDALRDSVTDLVNRTLFYERLNLTARRAARENRKAGRTTQYLYAVLQLNLDGFGKVNTDLGYDVGDSILHEAARRLEDCVRAGDTVARFGGDEFVLLLDDMKDVTDPTRVVQRIEQAFRRPFKIGGEDIRLTACMGIALNLAGGSVASLLEEARVALLRAKEQGPGSHRIHDVVIHARAMERLQLESRLRWAVENHQMTLHYQPIVEIHTGRLAGMEALVRWTDPVRGVVGPDQFISVAEETGAILPLGRWVLREAARKLGQWTRKLPDDVHLFMNVNVSGRQFVSPELADEVTEAILEHRLRPHSLSIEITETALMLDFEDASRALVRLKEASVGVHVDDFGTGYSSLAYLCRLPIDGLKIDRSFVAQMTSSTENLEVVRAIARLAETLGMSVIAEGVETVGQLAHLRELPCRYAQGYLFGHAASAEEADRLVLELIPQA